LRAFCQVALLELRRLVRSKTALALLLASVAWMLATPYLVKSDGTLDGARQIYVRFSLGGVFVLCAISLAASAASSLALERENRRLQLSRTRPVARLTLALARMFALTSLGAAVLAMSSLILLCNVQGDRLCNHVAGPVMESIEAEAARMYDYYMADPETPPEIKAAKKSTVMRVLRQGALDHYQSIAADETAEWTFPAPQSEKLSVSLRFTNDFDLRDDVRGEFSYGAFRGAVSNITQAVVHVPLEAGSGGVAGAQDGKLRFVNMGVSSLMLRPRKDIKLLSGADSFRMNLLRAYLELVSMLSATIAFAVFLGAGLGRPVAVFTCITFMFVSFASSDIIGQYPDQFETDNVDRIGLALTRAVEYASRPVNSLHPLASLSADECIEPGEAIPVALVDMVLLPLLFALLSSFAISLREDWI